MKIFTQWSKYAKYKLEFAKLLLMGRIIEDNVKLKIVFGGKEQSIDLQTLVSALECFFSASESICSEIYEDRKVQIKVHATSRGSFQIDISVFTQLLDKVKHLLEAGIDHVGYANDLVQLLIGYFVLKNFLKGKKPDKIEDAGDQTKIVSEGKTIYVKKEIYNIYSQNKKLNLSTATLFENLEEDEAVESFSLIPEGDIESLCIPREDFAGMAADNQLLEPEETVEIIENAELKIVKLVWQPKRKWEFIYNGVKISAYIDDADFYKRIEEGESFAKDDIIVCDMQITMLFEERLNGYLPKEFRIIKVKQHKPRKELQTKMFE